MPWQAAQAQTDSQRGERLTASLTGLSGVRHWLVRGTGGEYGDAVFAAGVPAVGSPWSSSLPGLTLRELSIAEIITAPRVGDNNAAVYVMGSYATPDVATGGGGAVPPDGIVLGKAYTQWDIRTAARTVSVDINGAPLPNPQGASIDDADLLITVTAYREVPPPLTTILPLLRPSKTNSNEFDLPPIYGSNAPGYRVLTGQARFVGVSRPRLAKEGVLEVEYTMAIAEDWKVRDRKRDARGVAVGPVIVSDVYTSAVFPVQSLWGTTTP